MAFQCLTLKLGTLTLESMTGSSPLYKQEISGAWEDWQLDCTAKASHIDIDEAMQWQLLQSGLIHVKQEGRE
jgi:hypothetical protein